MLKRIRIEVEEASAEECVEALSKYEHAIQQQEAKRYHNLWTEHPDDPHVIEDMPWRIGVAARAFHNDILGREVIEEVIEYNPDLPAYKGRRVIAFKRVDTRHPVYSDDPQTTAAANDEAVKTLSRFLAGSR